MNLEILEVHIPPLEPNQLAASQTRESVELDGGAERLPQLPDKSSGRRLQKSTDQAQGLVRGTIGLSVQPRCTKTAFWRSSQFVHWR